MNAADQILTVNAGSSSIKWALFEHKPELQQILTGSIKRIGQPDARFTVTAKDKKTNLPLDGKDFDSTIKTLLGWFVLQPWFKKVVAIGHRLVHGMQHTQPELINEPLIKALESIGNYDPDHLPAAITIIKKIREKFPDCPQVACFDTVFHTTMPPVAYTYAIPKAWTAKGIRRYGFHGISYAYLMQQLTNIHPAKAAGKVVLAHLGSGASIAAVKAGHCIDTSMGFTPAAGIVMGTRTGDIDPGIAWYLMQSGMDADAFNDLINHQAGLLGVSGLSADMGDLLKAAPTNKDAKLAVDIFCYQVIKCIGAYTAALGGLDVLIFSGGIGENAAPIRSRVCEALSYIGVSIDEQKNKDNVTLLSSTDSRVDVYRIATNEEIMIAQITAGIYAAQ